MRAKVRAKQKNVDAKKLGMLVAHIAMRST
jgi:hypothetical protein